MNFTAKIKLVIGTRFDREGKPINCVTTATNHTKREFIKEIGGCTMTEGTGIYVHQDGHITQESVLVVEGYTSKFFGESSPAILAGVLGERATKFFNQESVLVEWSDFERNEAGAELVYNEG